jgi:hypothetical protein
LQAGAQRPGGNRAEQQHQRAATGKARGAGIVALGIDERGAPAPSVATSSSTAMAMPLSRWVSTSISAWRRASSSARARAFCLAWASAAWRAWSPAARSLSARSRSAMEVQGRSLAWAWTPFCCRKRASSRIEMAK